MFKFMKARRDYWKVRKILASCENVGHVVTCDKLIHNYGKMYGFNHLWTELDKKCWSYLKEVLDRIEYQERLESIKDEQEISVNPEGEGDGVAPNT